VFVFDQDEHLDALMNFVKGETKGIMFGAGDRVFKTPDEQDTGFAGHCAASAHIRLNEYMFSHMQGKESTTH
jgi:hypothetical protein